MRQTCLLCSRDCGADGVEAVHQKMRHRDRVTVLYEGDWCHSQRDDYADELNRMLQGID
jgi:hypothetical protein